MVDTIKFSQMTNAGNINNNDIMPSLRSGENVILNNAWTFLPPGTTAQRPIPSSTINYRLRFNTDDQLYEYYDAVLGMWTQLQESAFTQGPFITYTADAALPDAQNLGALADGILKQTITLGIATLNIAVNGTDYYGPGFVIPGTDGGTGVNNGALTINLGTATTGFVLTSDSSGNATWQAVSSSGAITTIDGDSGSVTPLAGVVTISGASTGLIFTGASQTLSLGGLLNTAFGGTGADTFTAYSVLTAGTTATGAFQNVVGLGSTGNVLTSQGAGALPIWAPPATSGTVTSIATNNGITGGPITSAGTIGLASIADQRILANISGGSTFPSPNTLTAIIDECIASTQGDILYRNSSAWVALAPGTSGQVLSSGGAAANPSWINSPGNGTVSSGLINQLAWYAASGTTVSGLTTANNSVLGTDGSGAPSWSTTLPTGLTIDHAILGVPTINQINDTTFILPVLNFSGVASSVNFINAQNSATGNPPYFIATGTDTNISLLLKGKGTGGVGLLGYTDGSSAASGYIGEIISSVVASSTQSLSTGSAANVTSISLTAGDWDVWGWVIFLPDATTAPVLFAGAITTNSGTFPSLTTPSITTPFTYDRGTFVTGFVNSTSISSAVIQVSSTTLVYLVALSSFTVSTMTAGGAIIARRRR